jgi:hypothetical protein
VPNLNIHCCFIKTPGTPDSGLQSLNSIYSAINSPADNEITGSSTFQHESAVNFPPSSHTTAPMPDDEAEKNIDDCINERAANSRSTKQAPIVEQILSSGSNEGSATANNQLTELKQKTGKLQSTLDSESAKVQSLLDSGVKQTAKHEQEIFELMERIEAMRIEKDKNEQQQEKLKKLADSIKSIEYKNIQKEIIHEFLAPKGLLILDHLRETNKTVATSSTSNIPNMTFQGKNDLYTVIIVGFQGHHDGFKAIVQRIQSLLNVVQSAKDFYQRHLIRMTRTMTKDAIFQVTPKTQIWREYAKLFIQLFQEKTLEYKKKFDDYIQEKVKSLTDSCITAKLHQPWIEIRKETDDFLKNSPVMNEIESIKQKTLEEFIKQNISGQHLKLDRPPSLKSASVIQKFIDKIKTEFRTNKKYELHEFRPKEFSAQLFGPDRNSKNFFGPGRKSYSKRKSSWSDRQISMRC